MITVRPMRLTLPKRRDIRASPARRSDARRRDEYVDHEAALSGEDGGLLVATIAAGELLVATRPKPHKKRTYFLEKVEALLLAVLLVVLLRLMQSARRS